MNYGLNIFGIELLITSESPTIISALKSDYGFFEKTVQSPDWKIAIYQNFPGKPWGIPALKTFRSTVYWSRPGIRKVKFFNKCFVYCDFNRKYADLYFEDEKAGYESLYFVLESILSSELDERGMHRLHSFSAGLNGRSVGVLGKSGAGKSTLFANWFQDSAIKFLGDDMVVTHGQMVFSYPAKISFKEFPSVFPRSDIREFFRQQYGLRFLLDSRSVKYRFESKLPWDKLVLLKREKKVDRAKLVRVSRWRVLGWLVRWMVVGLETPQIAELFLPISLKAIQKKLGHFGSRVRRAWRISKEVPGYVYHAPEGATRMAAFLKQSLLSE